MKYAKTVVAVVGAAITAALGTLPPDTDVFRILTVVAAVLTAVGVYQAPYNTDAPKSEAGVVDLIGVCVIATLILVVLLFCGVHLNVH